MPILPDTVPFLVELWQRPISAGSKPARDLARAGG